MIIRIIIATAALALIFWLVSKSLTGTQEQRRKKIFYLACYGVAALLLVAVLTGRLHWLGAVFAAFLALAKFGFSATLRALPLLSFLKRNQVFGNPVFRTPFVEVKVDLQHNTFSGSILSGPHAGRELTSLSIDELRELEDHYRDRDKRSYYLIRVLISQGGPKSDQRQQQQHYSQVGDPSVEEALLILGLKGTPTAKDVIRAHRVLIQKLHPDRGGNDYLASRINVAKDVLLKHLDKK